ncbi:tyrosine-type recombinase/integrase [Streptococcus suis]
MPTNISKVLIIAGWKDDPVKKGNVLVKFGMRFTDPITRKTTRKYLSAGESKGWYTTKASPSGDRLLVSDIKNSQLITLVTNELTKIVDSYILEQLGEKREEVKASISLLSVGEAVTGLAFKSWEERVRPAKNTYYSRISVWNKHISKTFNTKMSIKQFANKEKEIQELINSVSIGLSKNIYIYIKMIFDWSLEHGYISLNDHPMLNKRVKYKRRTKSEIQKELRENIYEKYLEKEEVTVVLELIESWKNRPNSEVFRDIFEVMYLSGMRPSEVLGLNEDVLDFDSKEIKVHWQRISKNRTDAEMQELGLKDEKERYRADLKTVESIRVLSMTPRIEEILTKYIERNKFEAEHNPTYIDYGYIFTRTYIKKGNIQGTPFHQNELSSYLRGGSSQSAKHNKKSGKPYSDIDDLVDFGRPVHIVPHIFRHTFVSVMADMEVPLDIIRQMVGHSEDSKEIEKIYLHIMKRKKNIIKDAMYNLSDEMSRKQSDKNQTK